MSYGNAPRYDSAKATLDEDEREGAFITIGDEVFVGVLTSDAAKALRDDLLLLFPISHSYGFNAEDNWKHPLYEKWEFSRVQGLMALDNHYFVFGSNEAG